MCEIDVLFSLNKIIILLLPLILIASLFLYSPTLPSAHGNPGTGVVCIVYPSTSTSCPSSPLTIPVTLGQSFTVGIYVQGSDAMGGFDIFIASDPTFLSPTSAALGSLIASPSLTNICVSSLAITGSCPSLANGPGVVEVSTIESSGTNECAGMSPCSGLAFTITYSVVAAAAGTTLSYPTNAACSNSSISSPANLCVLVSDALGTTLTESIQTPAATITQNVPKDTTSTKVTCTSSTISVDSSTSCKANVTDTSQTSPSPPKLTVNFSTNSTGTYTNDTGNFPQQTSCTLQPGKSSAACAVSYKPTVIGTHSITVSYQGDLNHASSQGSFNLTATIPPGTTSTTVQCIPAAVINGTQAACTVTVTDISPVPKTPGGTVIFSSNSTGNWSVYPSNCTLGAGATAGSAVCVMGYTPSRQGTHKITGQYVADASHTPSLGTFNLVVTLLHPTVTTVVCDNTSITVGLTTRCEVGVVDTSPYPIGPSGTVTFTDSLGTFTPATAQCTLIQVMPTVSSCTIIYGPTQVGTGTHNIGASYSGDTAHAPSTAIVFSLTVKKASVMSFSSSVSQSSIALGGSATDLASLTGGYNPTGTVSYAAYSDSACTNSVFTSTVSLGSSSSSFTPGAVGTYYFVASYSGDSNNNATTTPCGASGETLTVTPVALHATTTGVVCAPNTVVVGASTTCTATVTDTSTSVTTPTGSISFSTDSSGSFSPISHTCNLASTGTGEASCSITYKSTSVGSVTHTITADYSGDSTHKTGSGNSQITVSAPSPTAPLTILGLSPTIFYAIIGVVVIVVIAIIALAIQRRGRIARQ